MRILFPVAIAAVLAGCSSEPTEEERAADVAEVEANQEPPVEELQPAQFTFQDIEAEDLFGAGCIFRNSADQDYGIAIAQNDAGYIKRGESVIRLASDKGSAELPYLAYSKYVGGEYSLTLDLDEDSGEQSGMETTDYAGTLTVRDPQDRTVYRASGTVQCGA